MKRFLGLMSMVARENLGADELMRTPEESLVMDTPGNVVAWHASGADDGPILPIYHFNARACGRLAPLGSTVIDLACGSGRFAAYLARRRPDLRIIGLDLSLPMVETGNAAMRDAGLSDRVELRHGDMTSFADSLPPETGLINCLFAIHHLPGMREVDHCLAEIRRASERTGCGFWIFDLVRPRHSRTASDYPLVFTPTAPQAFRDDSANSLMAAYSHDELKGAVVRAFERSTVRSARSRLLPLYQVFWRSRVDQPSAACMSAHASAKGRATLPQSARAQYLALRSILWGVPQ